MKNDEDLIWCCNECNSEEYSGFINRIDISNGMLQCSSCGCNEFTLTNNK